MANPEHLRILKSGVEEWNAWREHNPEISPDLSGAMLSGADCNRANLSDCNLTRANLVEANLTGANLVRSLLCGAYLFGANLRHVKVHLTNLDGAVFGSTIMTECEYLHRAQNMHTILHYNSSSLDHTTLRDCIHGLPDIFLQGCGYTQHEIDYLRALYVNSPIKYFSCFISHGEPDLAFADRLLADLRQKNVTCWHYKADMRGGRDWRDQVDEAIKVHDKLLLVCSRQSVYREQVVREILKAIDEERRTGEQKLFPVRLDDHITSPGFREEAEHKAKTKEWREDWVYYINRIHIPDFSGWEKDNEKYVREFGKLLRDLVGDRV